MEQKRKWLGAVGLVVVAAMLLGASPRSGGASVTLYETDAGRTIELQRGDRVIVKLEGNPSTGYSWTVEAVEGEILSAEGEPDFAAESVKIGAGGTYTLTFAAARPGRAVLKLLYHQVWDKETPPAKTFEVTVVVE
jgi:inhibitor of cysteine peptidase